MKNKLLSYLSTGISFLYITKTRQKQPNIACATKVLKNN